MHVDDSACNLASLNLMKFRRPDGTLDVESFEHTVDIMLLAQEIVVGPSSYPTEEIARQRAGLPPARPGLREPRGVPDGGRDALRLRAGPRRRGGDHGADDRPRVPPLGGDRGGARPLRALRGKPRGAQRGDADAPRRRPCDPRSELRGPRAARPPRGAHGRRRWRWASASATATRRPPCSPRRERSRS